MTRDSSFKRTVRARMAKTNEPYNVARHAVLAEHDGTGGPEPHYQFTPTPFNTPGGTIERVDRDGRRELEVPEEEAPSFTWGYGGSGPNTSSWALLLDATGTCDHRLAVEFSGDNLAWDELQGASLVITVAEVRAWRAAREPEIRKQPSNDMRLWTVKDLMEEHDPFEVRRPWWEQYREQFGEPRLK